MSGKTELLPCPFCGGEAYVHEHYSFHGYERKGTYPNYEPIGYAVGCMTFDCRGKRENTGFMYSTEAEAIAAWNARAERGTLTAEQVCEAIERNFGKVAVLDDGGPVEWRDDWVCKVGINYKAIADELNARAERACEIEHVKGGAMYDVWRYTCCGYEYAESVSETGIVQNYCPNCGARVVA